MTTLIILFIVGYLFHLAYKLIDNIISLLRKKRHDLKGDQDEAA